MFNAIDRILNKIPMYRITLYIVGLIWTAAIGLGFLGVLPYSGFSIALSGIFLMLVSWIANEIFAWAFNASTNHESAYITGLILALIVPPAVAVADLPLLATVAVVAMASKYILAIHNKHLFNPAAIAVFITGFIGLSASWWIGTGAMLPFVAVFGYLLVRKINRTDMVLSFIITALVIGIGYDIVNGLNALMFLQQTFISSGFIFLATVMLTEPLTTPPTRTLRIIYGSIVAFFFLPFVHLGSIYAAPELALILGNVFVYIVSPKQKLILTLKKKIRLSEDLYDFIFESDQKFKFRAGQYLEWTLNDVSFNTKGNRRYFTIASAPSEKEIRVGIRLQDPVSEFKKEMLAMEPGDKIIAAQLSGDFVLPKNKSKKLAFIAGGIGITPFRSMVKDLVDRNDHRPTTLFFSGASVGDIIYTDVFEDARKKLGMKTVYTVTDKKAEAKGWGGNIGRITKEMIKEVMPDYRQRQFYISGSQALVSGMKQMLLDLGIKKSNIKTDYFSGFI